MVVGYDTEGGRIGPLFETDRRIPAERAIFAELLAGSEAYITDTLDH